MYIVNFQKQPYNERFMTPLVVQYNFICEAFFDTQLKMRYLKTNNKTNRNTSKSEGVACSIGPLLKLSILMGFSTVTNELLKDGIQRSWLGTIFCAMALVLDVFHFLLVPTAIRHVETVSSGIYSSLCTGFCFYYDLF